MTGARGEMAVRRLSPVAAGLWGYVRHELLYLCYALMELSLLIPFALSLMGWARYWPVGRVTLWLLLLMLLPFNLIRLMTLLKVDSGRQRWIMFTGLLITVLLSWRTLLYSPSGLLDMSWLRQFGAHLAEASDLLWTRDLLIFLLILFVWWRGIRLAMRPHEINALGLRLRLGGLIFAPLLIWFGATFLDFSIVPFILLFFLSGLTAVALVRAEQIEQEQSGRAASLSPYWFLIVLLAAISVVAVAGAAAALISGDYPLRLLTWLSPLVLAAQFGGATIIILLADLLSPFANLLAITINFLARIAAFILGGISEGLRQLQPQLEIATPVLPTPEATVEIVGTGMADKAIAALVMLGLIFLVSLALVRLYRQATFAARDARRSETIAQDQDEQPGLGQRLLERLGLFRQWRAAASIRRIYAQMCRAAAEVGYPRLETETPYEYLQTLARAWPTNTADSRLITEAYVRVRYGQYPETAEELERIRQAWRRLEATKPVQGNVDREVMPTLQKRE